MGIVLDPIKCAQCETVYCKTCLPPDALDIELNSTKPYKCFKKCGSKELTELTRIERNILDSLKFKCQHSLLEGDQKCTAIVKYEHIRKHLETECTKRLKLPTKKSDVIVTKEPKIDEIVFQYEAEPQPHQQLQQQRPLQH